MRKFSMWKMFGIIGMCLGLAACGEKVEVPPSHVGKVMGSNGYKEGTIPTSKFRLDACWAYCDKIVLLDVSDKAINERIELFMPLDKLIIVYDVRMTLAVNPNKYEELFNRIAPSQDANSGQTIIGWMAAYTTYAQQIVRAEAREILSKYTIADIASNRESINAELSKQLIDSISKNTPFVPRFVGTADIKFPAIIVTAQENAAERREAIQQEEAQLEVSKVKLERELQEAQMRRKIDVEKADAESKVNKILADSVTQSYINYRNLQIMEKLAESQNKVFMPYGMIDSIAGQTMVGRQ